MPRTLGYHLVISGYGLWLPGDDRGSWSASWDSELGYIEPHTLHAGDPIRRRMALERQSHPAMRLTPYMISVVHQVLARCALASDWKIAAGSIEPSHTHLLLTYTKRDIDNVVKWLKDQTTKAIHRKTAYEGPIWCKGKWCAFIYELARWRNTKEYIERHNVRRGEGPRPYSFLGELPVELR